MEFGTQLCQDSTYDNNGLVGWAKIDLAHAERCKRWAASSARATPIGTVGIETGGIIQRPLPGFGGCRPTGGRAGRIGILSPHQAGQIIAHRAVCVIGKTGIRPSDTRF